MSHQEQMASEASGPPRLWEAVLRGICRAPAVGGLQAGVCCGPGPATLCRAPWETCLLSVSPLCWGLAQAPLRGLRAPSDLPDFSSHVEALKPKGHSWGWRERRPTKHNHTEHALL